MSQPKCPICKKPAAPRADNPAFPFCSGRCKDIDLGDWLGERYVIAAPPLNFNFPLPTDPDDDEQ